MLTEEEGLKLRHFIDEPTFTDLHWVCLISYFQYYCTDNLKTYFDLRMLDTILITEVDQIMQLFPFL